MSLPVGRLVAAFALCVGSAVALAGVEVQEPASKVFDCGGLHEQACAAFSWGRVNNGGLACDRGLVEVEGFCRDSLNKWRSGIGLDFRETWAGRGLRHQLKGLNWRTQIDFVPFIMAHNAYNSEASVYVAPDQTHSLSELLDAGFRAFEIDVWSTVTDWLRLCHGGVCPAGDRSPHNFIKELANWMLAFPEEAVIIQIEDHINDDANLEYFLDFLNDPIEAYLVDSGVGVWSVADMAGRGVPGSYHEYPSLAEMRKAGKRVLFGSDKANRGPYINHFDDFVGTPGYLSFAIESLNVAGGECPIRARSTTQGTTLLSDPFSAFQAEFSDVWSPFVGELTYDHLAFTTRCAVNFSKMNFLLRNDSIVNSPHNLKAGVWSWADPEPLRSDVGVAAYLDASFGRWRARDRTAIGPYVCGKQGRHPLSGVWLEVFIELARDLTGGLVTGPWEGGYEACRNHGTGWSYWAPRNQVEDELAKALSPGMDLWFNFAPNRGGEWVVNTGGPSVVLAAGSSSGPNVIHQGKPMTLHFISPDDPDLGWLPHEVVKLASIDWGDGNTWEGLADPSARQHVYTTAGSFTITVGLRDHSNVIGTTTRTITVLPNAPPVVTATLDPSPNAAGWNTTPVTIRWTAVEDGVVTTTACPDVQVLGDTTGAVHTCSVTNDEGATGTETVTVRVDTTPPTIVVNRWPLANGSGWNNSDVSLSYTCVDATAGIEPGSCTAPTIVTTDGAGQSRTAVATDQAGHTTTIVVSEINIDKVAPTISAARAPLANAHAWNNTEVIVSFSCADALSGLDATGCPAAATVTTDGAGQSRSGSVTDLAGNTASVTVGDINIDRVSPIIAAARAPMANAHGWNNTHVTVTFTCDDALSGVPPTGCSDAVVVATLGEGQSRLGVVTDRAGNSASVVVGGISIDWIPPTITGTRAPLANAYGWNNTPVTVSFTCADQLSLSGLDASGCPAAATVATDGTGQSRTGVVSDRAGNMASVTVGDINIDSVPPTIAGARTPLPNANGWNNTDVTVSFTCGDAGSGLITTGCPPPAVVVTEGAAQSRAGIVTDRAGNAASVVVGGINVDKTPPTFMNVRDVVVDAAMPEGAVVAYATPDVSDALTGAIDAVCLPISGTMFPVGTTDVHCVAADKAGNVAQAAFTVTVLSPLQQLNNLQAAVEGVGPGDSFGAGVRAATAALARGQNRVAVANLRALINRIDAQSGKSISAANAAVLKATVDRIIRAVGS